MSFLSFIIFSHLFFNLFDTNVVIACPSSYISILNGCYKVTNGINMTWSAAQQYCINDSHSIITNKTGYVTHLVALESAIETTSLIYWLKAFSIQTNMWTDGIASSSSWDWSNQSIVWYFNSSNQVIYGNGSNYRLAYDSSQYTYDIADADSNKVSQFICEYQDRCNTNNSCQNNATCYLNVGRELCICGPGYTGTTCDQQIDECLSSPCQHGGICSDSLNNYTCDCSNLFFSGPNCENPNDDPSESQRSAAFWSVVGIVCGLVVLLTLSDLPWDEIASSIGCPWFRFKCCFSRDGDGDEDDDIIDRNEFGLNGSPINETNITSQQINIPGTSSKGGNYQVMNTVWNPDRLRNESPSNPQYNGYRSPDPNTTPDNVLIQSFATVVLAKHKAKETEDRRIYAVDILPADETTSKTKNAADTMVSWTQQLQEQLKNKETRPTSASSTKELIQSEIHNENE